MKNPFRYFNSSPEVIRLTVMLYIRYPLSLREFEDLLFERGIDICYGAKRGAAQRAALMEPLRTNVRGGDQTRTRGKLTCRTPVALAPG